MAIVSAHSAFTTVSRINASSVSVFSIIISSDPVKSIVKFSSTRILFST